MKLSVIIPVYNEEKRIVAALDALFAVQYPMELEVIVVNDGSKDASQQLIEEYIKAHPQFEVRTLVQVNQGKSRAVRNGVLMTIGDWVVIYDADLEYAPADLLPMLDLVLKDSELDVVYGNRFGQHNPVIYWHNYIGNRALSLVSGVLTYLRAGFITNDMEVCYKLIRGNIFREIATELISTSMFGIEPEITARLARYIKQNGKHIKFAEVPISYKPRTIAEGKKMKAFQHGILALWEIFRFNLLPLPKK